MSERARIYQAMIDELDVKHKELLDSQPEVTGNQKDIFTTVSQRMLAEKQYLDERQKLIELRNEATEVSPAVAEYLKPKKVESKFDLDSGTTTIDNSNIMEGKKL
jgi:hypothetical protein